MTNDIELELIHRPNDGSAVSLVANRLRLRLLNTKTGSHYDHTPRDQPDRSFTVAPPGALAWCAHTETVWNKVEWVERHGPVPIAFELRTVLPDSLRSDGEGTFARAVARFVAQDLGVPVTANVLDGTGAFPTRDSVGRHLCLCFPARVLALPNGANAVGDRSNEPSGFSSRLLIATNPHLARQFTQRVALEVARLQHATGPKRSLSHIEKKDKDKDPFLFDDIDLLPDPIPQGSPSEDPATHPLLVRLRREAPRSRSLQDLRDFEMSLGMARTVEDMLAEVVARDRMDAELHLQHSRLASAVLDHQFQLDEARRRRGRLTGELDDLSRAKTGFLVFRKGKMELAVLARERKVQELDRARQHVVELKAAIAHLRKQDARVGQDCTASFLALGNARRELKDAVRGLHAADPRLLDHLMVILDDVQRRHMKRAMADALPVVMETEPSSAEDTRAGPPAKPSRRVGPM
ncbi:hypothetical protein ABIE56_000405 [Luteibacter sp. 621]|uniref:MobA/MobL family protein n=1 Tax=Luteibacter sp. 621 TaxID=3373916 RepID=UPI003D262639